MCNQSVNNNPTIANGQLSFNNQQHASDTTNIKWDYVCNLVKESEVKMLENKAKYPGGHKHKILIIADSHMRGCAVKMSASLDARFEVRGVIKPGSCTESISGTMKEEVDNLTINDFLILSSRSNDISRNDSRLAFRNIVNYIKNVKHTNVILIGTPFRYDTLDCSHLNNSVKLFNSKLGKLAKILAM
jgi:hypothetical protein